MAYSIIIEDFHDKSSGVCTVNSDNIDEVMIKVKELFLKHNIIKIRNLNPVNNMFNNTI